MSTEKKAEEPEDLSSFTTITLRISTPIIKKLRNDSEGKGISLNAVINQALRHYVEWDAFEPQVGMIPFPKTVLGKIFAEMSEEQIVKLATNTGMNAAIDAAILMRGRIDVSDFISWIELRLKNSGSQIIHRLNKDDNDNTIIIKPDLGKNWSLYLKTMIISALTDVFKIQVNDIIITDTILSIRFKFKKKEEKV